MRKFRTVLKDKLKFLRSMGLWLFIVFFILALVPCMILSSTLLSNYEKKAVNIRTTDVSNQLHIISDHLITYGYLKGSGSEVIDAELTQLSNLYDGRILIINSDLRVIKDTYGISQGRTIISSEVIRAFKGESVSIYDDENGYIEIATPIIENVTSGEEGSGRNAEASPIVGVMLSSASITSISNTQNALRRLSDIFEVITFVIALASSYFASHFMMKPFKKLTSKISDVKDGYTSDPVMVKDFRETEQISEAFNQVVGRMSILDKSRQEFVSNVSHELKTPMTSIKILADSLLSQEEAPAELYREFMEDITKEIDRENHIISDLLTLVKMDKTSSELTISQVEVNSLIEAVLKRLRPIARKKDVELTFESLKMVNAAVDEVKLSQVITNLVENAIKYNDDHGWVKVKLDADHHFFTIVVADSGIGMDQEALDHIFERFYRVDKSHSREIGGTGLGLAITRSAVLMHRGSIQVESTPGEGTAFTVRLPLTYIAG